jgi:hypothetical protein
VGFLAINVGHLALFATFSRKRGKRRTDLSDSGGPLKVRLLPASDWSRNSTSSSSWDTREEQLKLNTRFEIEEFIQKKCLEKLWFRPKKILDSNDIPESQQPCLWVSDSYPAFFLLIATTSNKNFLKVQEL